MGIKDETSFIESLSPITAKLSGVFKDVCWFSLYGDPNKESKVLIFESEEPLIPLKDFYDMINVQGWILKSIQKELKPES